jgi:alkyldihydroxyacetonephosphate synthase
MVSYRVTQTYDVGCCVYFYFALKWNGVGNPLTTYEHLEASARNEILASGGSLSHHHGIGKLRSRWFPSQVSKLGVELYRATKRQLDPKNIFANGNISNLDL